MVKILHAADFHLDTPFENLPSEKAVQRRREQRELLMQLARLVKKEQVQLVLLAGDLLDSSLSYHETYEALYNALKEMEVPVFISPGNHDYYCSKSPYASMEFPENVHIFKSPIIDHVDLPKLGCRVWGAGFNAPLCFPLTETFEAPRSDLVNLMVIHGELGGDSYNPIREKNIPATNLDYLALGHVHTFSGIRQAGKTYYAYPGCTQGRGFDETGVKGVIIGNVGKGEANMRFVPLGGREYRIVKAGQAKLDQAIPRDCQNHICRLILTGQWSEKPDLEAIYNKYSSKFFHLTIKDETTPLRDVWQGLEEDNLKGLFLRRMREKYDAPGADREQILMALEYGLAAFDNREEWKA